jgi:hypothetical protein
MPRTQEKKKKLGRNDPCWCGSGKKYKDCHLPIEDARRTELRKLRQAQDTLLPKIMEAAQEMPDAVPAALHLFWNGEYTPDQMGELDDLEDRGSDRFLAWYAFDYPQDDGHTLVERLVTLADEGGFDVNEHEQRLLRDWAGVRLRPYVIEEVRKGKGLLVRDLLNDQRCDVEEHSASRRLEEGEVLVGHLVPVALPPADAAPLPQSSAEPTGPTYYVAGAAAQLTEDTAEKLLEFAQLHLADLQRTQPEATLDDLARQRSHVFNHFVMELPEEHTPGVLDDVLLRTRTALSLAGVSLPGGAPKPAEQDGTATDAAEKER